MSRVIGPPRLLGAILSHRVDCSAMSQDPKTNGAGSAGAQAKPKQEKSHVPSVGALDEDDEFEEFETPDWPDKDAAIPGTPATAGAASIALDMSGSTRSGGDHLWEDNWDDDDVEDDFSAALRAELEKTDGVEAMAT
ncbi:hypothetical protein MSPP1_002649 [Malassezia sp. CBS 17886]|nr:hypothetical protein MSPP1_002649 [Malassezia sp. CBS 17886]